ncbi:MAG: hypothetical protein GX638_10870, partial [Crenarchaeota archaeon]|nr:hypothetical protein [Thermoproteota archaeon]
MGDFKDLLNNLFKNRKVQIVAFIMLLVFILSKYVEIDKKMKNAKKGDITRITKYEKYNLIQKANIGAYRIVHNANEEKGKIAKAKQIEENRENQRLAIKKEIDDFNNSEYDKKSRAVKNGDRVKIKMLLENLDIPES